MSNKLTFEEWSSWADNNCNDARRKKECQLICESCKFAENRKAAWNFAQAQEQKEIEELKKKVEALERDNSELSAGCCIELLCGDGGNPTCKARIENESLKKKLEKADFLARAFAKECPDSEKARAYLKENEG